jgi:hypothetical protein
LPQPFERANGRARRSARAGAGRQAVTLFENSDVQRRARSVAPYLAPFGQQTLEALPLTRLESRSAELRLCALVELFDRADSEIGAPGATSPQVALDVSPI